MAAPFKKTVIQSFPHVGEKVTGDTIFWKNFEFPVTKKEFGSISSIDFSPVQPYNFATTCSTKVQIHSIRTNQVEKTFSKFKEEAYGGCFRSDGRLLVAGGAEKLVKMFDVSSKSLLRVFRGHVGAVHVTRFTRDNRHVMSASDDYSIRLWDIASESQTACYSEHTDYVRSGVTSLASNDILVTGSYDHTVRLFDSRVPKSVFTMDHGSPVESVLMFPGGGVLLSAGGTDIKVWDTLAGGRLLAQFSNHHKTVTSLCFCSDHQRLMSGSLDRHVKIYDVTSYQVVHTLDYPAPVMSLGISPDNKVLVVGMSDGLLSIQHKKADDVPVSKSKKHDNASFKYIVKSHTPIKEDHVVQHKRRIQLSRYDKYLKTFQYSKALEAALDLRVRNKTPDVTVSVFLELIRRDGLKTALAGRDDKSLSIILKFLQKNISNVKFMTCLVDVSNVLLELYTPHVGQSSELDSLLLRLKETIDLEVNYMKKLMQVMGTMDTILAASNRNIVEVAPTENDIKHAVLQPSVAAQAL